MPIGYVRVGNYATYQKKINEQRTLEFSFFYDEFYPSNVNFDGASAKIIFNNVESVFKNILNENALPNNSITHTHTVKYSLRKVDGFDREWLRYSRVSDDITFNTVRPMLDKLVIAAEQAFDRFQTLEDVYTYAESLDEEAKSYFIGQPFDFKYSIIKRLIETPDWETYAIESIDFYKAENSELDWKFAEALYDELKSLDSDDEPIV